MALGSKRFGVLFAGGVGLMLGACGGPPVEETEGVGTASQELVVVRGNEVSTVYYSDNTYTVQVGWTLTRCDSSSVFQGQLSGYYKQAVYPCY
ncbi:hypothetical protein [Corallococcus exercitus]|uniref:hypothetical protein n=1 Tax=Corallococcus exercitus TaxID=2316736 RepID=UPI0035D48470